MPKNRYRRTPREPNANSTNPGNIDDGAEDEEEEEVTIKQYLISLGRDILIAVIVMVIIIGSLWGYTGNWPPMVVIESNSMMHGDDSSVGTIDTGDLVLVKKISSAGDITTYVEGKKSGYETYGSYGDVIIFRKNGLEETPVIHRAVVWLQFNHSAHNIITHNNNNYNVNGFDVPSMGKYNITEIWIPNYKPKDINLSIKLGLILVNFQLDGREPHSGFLTKGDNNQGIDQTSSLIDSKHRHVGPVKPEWIVGKAEGELPWFGLIKLFITGETSQPEKAAPPTSVNMLILSIVLIIVIPIILDLSFSYIAKYRKRKKEEKEGEGAPPDESAQLGQPPASSSKWSFKRHKATDDGESAPRQDKRQDKRFGPQDIKSKPSDRTGPEDRMGRKAESGSQKPSDSISKDDLLKKIK